MLKAVSIHRQDHIRDRALLLTLFNTGARVQELLDIRPSDLQLDRPTSVHLRGKGRKGNAFVRCGPRRWTHSEVCSVRRPQKLPAQFFAITEANR